MNPTSFPSDPCPSSIATSGAYSTRTLLLTGAAILMITKIVARQLANLTAPRTPSRATPSEWTKSVQHLVGKVPTQTPPASALPAMLGEDLSEDRLAGIVTGHLGLPYGIVGNGGNEIAARAYVRAYEGSGKPVVIATEGCYGLKELGNLVGFDVIITDPAEASTAIHTHRGHIAALWSSDTTSLAELAHEHQLPLHLDLSLSSALPDKNLSQHATSATVHVGKTPLLVMDNKCLRFALQTDPTKDFGPQNQRLYTALTGRRSSPTDTSAAVTRLISKGQDGLKMDHARAASLASAAQDALPQTTYAFCHVKESHLQLQCTRYGESYALGEKMAAKGYLAVHLPDNKVLFALHAEDQDFSTDLNTALEEVRGITFRELEKRPLPKATRTWGQMDGLIRLGYVASSIQSLIHRTCAFIAG